MIGPKEEANSGSGTTMRTVPGFTIRQYAHALPAMHQQAAAVIDATIRAATTTASEGRADEGANPVIWDQVSANGQALEIFKETESTQNLTA